MSSATKILPFKHISEVTKEAILALDDERHGEQLGLYTRFPKFNVAMNKYSRFSHVTLIAAASGAGKSYFINILEEDFTDSKGLNKDFKGKVMLIAFKFEMEGKDELIRAASRDMGVSYNYLLSSEYIGNSNYNQLTDTELADAVKYFKSIEDKKIYYIESIGDCMQILHTVQKLCIENPGYRPIVTIDHSLLTKKSTEKSDMELISNIAITAIVLRKTFKAMVYILGQLNSNIESVERRIKKELHYPIKTDIYAQAQLYWACDNVFILNRPELLGIEEYGKLKLPTQNLVHMSCIKSRKGRLGNIFLMEQLNKSTFSEITVDYLLEKRKKNEENIL